MAVVILGVASSWSVSAASLAWKPPQLGVVRDAEAAITIAHAIVVSMYPAQARSIGSGADWQNEKEAVLKSGVWQVSNRKPVGIGGSGIVVLIDKLDGRVRGIYIDQ